VIHTVLTQISAQTTRTGEGPLTLPEKVGAACTFFFGLACTAIFLALLLLEKKVEE
jgi:hypothetical protein